MQSIWKNLGISGVLSVFMLLLGLTLQPDITFAQAAGLLALGLATGLSRVTLRLFQGVFVMCAVLLALVIFTPILKPISAWMTVSEPPKKVDLIVILGAGMSCGSGDLEASSMARLLKGLELWNAGYAPRITLSDTVGEIFNDASCPSVGRQSEKIISQLYNSEPEVYQLPEMYTTRTEAIAVAKLTKEKGWESILLVTAPTHTRRAWLTFKEQGLDVTPIAAYEARYDSQFTKPADRINALYPILRELIGLAKYQLSGWL